MIGGTISDEEEFERQQKARRDRHAAGWRPKSPKMIKKTPSGRSSPQRLAREEAIEFEHARSAKRRRDARKRPAARIDGAGRGGGLSWRECTRGEKVAELDNVPVTCEKIQCLRPGEC